MESQNLNDLEKFFSHDTDLITPPSAMADEVNSNSSAPQIIPNADYFEKYLASCYDTVLTSEDFDINQMSESKGTEEFRKAIATFMFRFHGIDVSPDRIIVGAGTQSLLTRILRLPSIVHPEGIPKQEGLLSRAEQIATGTRPIVAFGEDEDEQVRDLFFNSKIKIKTVPVDKQIISFDSLLSSGATLLYITPRETNSSISLEELNERRQEFFSWANAMPYRFIIEYDSTKKITTSLPPFKKEDTNDNVIYLNSFSSLLCKGISTSWAVLPEKLFAEYDRIYQKYPCQVSYLEQTALTMFMEKRYLDNYLETIQSSLEEDELEDELAF